ncbi:MAG TPA: hypothetical protein VK558_01520 [Patescibacteria group bacterium]|nr:hypothetical protein [Patescibacteria group bacterium]
MKSNDWVLLGAGLTMGAIVGLVFGAAVVSSCESPLASLLLKDGRLQWETLVGGIMALVAASATVWTMKWQTEDQRRRRGRAALSVLPLMLSELFDYVTSCTEGLLQLRACDAGGRCDPTTARNVVIKWQRPRLPENCAGVLKECIEFADVPVAGEMIALLSKLQIQHARFNSTYAALMSESPSMMILTQNIRTYILDIAEIHARATMLLRMTRSVKDTVEEVMPRDIRTALMHLLFFDDSDKILMDMADRWSPTTEPSTPS